VLVPSEELTEKAVGTSRKLAAEHQTVYELGTERCFSHVSLRLIQLREVDLHLAEDRLTDIANRTPVMNLQAQRYAQFRRFVDVNYRPEWQWDHLQRLVKGALGPLHDLRYDPESKNLANLGYSPLGEQVEPHLTLSRLATEELLPLNSLPDAREFSGDFPKLALYELGPNGACVRPLVEVDLRPSPDA
jgi:hypothetical protein